MPVGGIKPQTTHRFMRSWQNITAVMPNDKYVPILSFAFSAILSPIEITAKYISIRTKQPNKPVSSPIIEKIKSLSEKGRNKYFCRLLKSPTPNSPPEPSE